MAFQQNWVQAGSNTAESDTELRKGGTEGILRDIILHWWWSGRNKLALTHYIIKLKTTLSSRPQLSLINTQITPCQSFMENTRIM